MKTTEKTLYKTTYYYEDGTEQTEYLLTESFFELLEETDSARRRCAEIKAHTSWAQPNQDPNAQGTRVQTYNREGC